MVTLAVMVVYILLFSLRIMVDVFDDSLKATAVIVECLSLWRTGLALNEGSQRGTLLHSHIPFFVREPSAFVLCTALIR